MKLAYFLIALFVQSIAWGQSYDVYASQGGSKMTYKNSNGLNSFNIEVRGTIEITDDDRDIKSISPDGYLEITKTSFGSKRTIKITAEGNTLKREYFEGRTQMPYEPEGRKWLSEVLPEVVRTTTIAAESRVNRFYRNGGVSGVLGEISRLEGSYMKSHYANLLMKLPVQTKDYPLIITKIASQLDSDHYLTEFLDKNMAQFIKTGEALEAVLAATEKMESDHYKTQVIKEALRNQSISAEGVKIILATVANMDSDHYKTEIFNSLLRQSNLSDAVLVEILNSTKSIDSDHYRTQVLTRVLDRNLSPAAYQKAIESAREIDSDHYLTQVIKNMMSKPMDSEVLTTLLSLTTFIESDHYRTEVITTLLRKQNLQEDQFKKLVEYSSGMDSDHYQSQTLQTALSTSNLTDGKLIAVLQAAAQIESDHYITEVLVDAAPAVKSAGNPVKEAYRAAARKIDSETYYGRALRAIENY